MAINISDPTNPGAPVHKALSSNAYDVYVSGDYAYVADGSFGLAVINISDPTNLGTPVYEATNGNAWDVHVSGNYAYLADDTAGLAVIDISDPTNPGTPIYENTTGRAHGVYVSGDYAYIADDMVGLAVIDISDPTNPGLPVYGPSLHDTRGIYVSGDYAYIADGAFGLAVIQVRKRVDMEDPILSNVPSNFNVVEGYTGQSLSWTATDTNPDNYTIELIGTGIVVPSTPWINNSPAVYNIPDGFNLGSYIYMVNFTDDYGNSIVDNVTLTVENAPILTSIPNDLTVEFGYTGQSLSWKATDVHPYNYTIELQGTGIVVGPTNWTSGLVITYNIPDGFTVGAYIYIVNFTDDYDNSITDSVTFTAEDTTDPVIFSSSNDITTEVGYTDLAIWWIATDIFPDTYTIEMVGIGIVVGPITWTSHSPINYEIPNEFAPGVYNFTITLTDDSGNTASGTITVTITSTYPGGIPFGDTFLVITVLSIFGLLFAKKRKIVRKSG